MALRLLSVNAHILIISIALVLLVTGCAGIAEIYVAWQGPSELKGDQLSAFNYNASLIFLTAFAAIGFAILWSHNVREVQLKSELTDYFRSFIKPDQPDFGMIWMAAAMLCWELRGVVGVWFPDGPHIVLGESISTLNSTFFLLVLSNLTFGKAPSWYSNRLVEWFREVPVIIGFSAGVWAMTLFLWHVGNGNGPLAHFPDLLYSILVISLLWLYLSHLFRERNLHDINTLVAVTMVLIFGTHLFEALQPQPSDSFLQNAQRILMLTWKIFLIVIFYTIAYSWRGFLERLAFERKAHEKEAVGRDLNHAVKASLRNIVFDLESELRENPHDEIRREILGRLIHLRDLHNQLHGDVVVHDFDPGYNDDHVVVDVEKYFRKMVDHLEKLHSFSQSQVDLRIRLRQPLRIRIDTARKLMGIPLELFLNACKAYIKTGTPPDARKLLIECIEQGEGSERRLTIRVVDRAGGIVGNRDGYGLKA